MKYQNWPVYCIIQEQIQLRKEPRGYKKRGECGKKGTSVGRKYKNKQGKKGK